jgi:hypothetical protein
VLGWLAKSCIRDRVRLVRVAGFKDTNALYLDHPQLFAERWQAALDAAEPFDAIADRKAATEAQRTKDSAGDLIIEPDVLTRFGAEIERAGLAGEGRNAKVLYLVLTTRVLDRPVNAVVKGPSSGGKNFIVKRVVTFFPAEAYWSRTSMSDRTLAYSDEDFRHRHFILYEAAGSTSDIATYLIRSLLSEGCIEYEFVEKTKDGMRARVLRKDGPTGFITTTTAAQLHSENETHYEPWHAYQRLLASGERRVFVPFAKALASEIPTVAVRLRRDFPMLLSLVKAHALLHREFRARDKRGRIVATFADYAIVRELVADLFSEGVDATVAKSLRETVEAVKVLAHEEVSLADVTRVLNLDRSSVSRRVKVAIGKGYLVNRETGKGKRARIALDDPMPDDIEIFPPPDKLADRCGVAAIKEGTESLSPPADCDAELAEIEI